MPRSSSSASAMPELKDQIGARPQVPELSQTTRVGRQAAAGQECAAKSRVRYPTKDDLPSLSETLPTLFGGGGGAGGGAGGSHHSPLPFGPLKGFGFSTLLGCHSTSLLPVIRTFHSRRRECQCICILGFADAPCSNLRRMSLHPCQDTNLANALLPLNCGGLASMIVAICHML